MDKEFLSWLKKLIQEDNLDPFYNSKRWRKLSKEAKKRDKNECQMCKDKGLYKAAKQVHHIEEVKDNPMRALDITNLTSLCIECHNTLHNRQKKLNTSLNKLGNIFPERW